MFPKYVNKHITNSRIALVDTFNEISANVSLNNGKSDAFRHAFWNAIDTRDIGLIMTIIFTNAHEWEETGIDSQMDLFNNNQGRLIGVNYNNSTSNHIIEFAIIQAVFDGVLEYLSPTDANGGIIPGTTQRVPTNQ